MDKDQLIVRLSLELYDLKQKLEYIRGKSDTISSAYNLTDNVKKKENLMRAIKELAHLGTDIVNSIDSIEIYD